MRFTARVEPALTFDACDPVVGELHTLKVVLKLLGIDWSAWETPSTEDLEVWTHSGEWCRDKSH